MKKQTDKQKIADRLRKAADEFNKILTQAEAAKMKVQLFLSSVDPRTDMASENSTLHISSISDVTYL